jgi:hypothetical protein
VELAVLVLYRITHGRSSVLRKEIDGDDGRWAGQLSRQLAQPTFAPGDEHQPRVRLAGNAPRRSLADPGRSAGYDRNERQDAATAPI